MAHHNLLDLFLHRIPPIHPSNQCRRKRVLDVYLPRHGGRISRDASRFTQYEVSLVLPLSLFYES